MRLPDEVGIMVLPGLVFFPHNLAPLHIFEPRYREMLAKALDSHRMFGICHARDGEPCEVGGVGIIRACVRNADGTSNLILQGVARVRFTGFTQTRPYYVGSPLPLGCGSEATSPEEDALQARIVEMVGSLPCLRPQSRDEAARFLDGISDPEMLVDIVAGNFLECAEEKQLLLETEGRTERLHLLTRCLHRLQTGA